MFDVGQGDSLLIRAADNYKVLIDGGGDNEVSRYINHYQLMNTCSLDLVILTHAHADHLVGLNRVLQNC